MFPQCYTINEYRTEVDSQNRALERSYWRVATLKRGFQVPAVCGCYITRLVGNAGPGLDLACLVLMVRWRGCHFSCPEWSLYTLGTNE